MIKPAIVCIAKCEEDYIEEFVRYHLSLGFDRIYIYDNNDELTYAEQLNHFGDAVIVIHLPGRNYPRLPQYEALQQFTWNYLHQHDNTHIAHIDIDEFIVLKKHSNIKDFIKEYIFDGENGVMCGGIGMNWKWFGSSGALTKTDEPVTTRFTKCQKGSDQHIKTLYYKHIYAHQGNPHSIVVNNSNLPIKTTNGIILDGPFNPGADLSVIQLNHYKVKSREEYRLRSMRGKADRYINEESEDTDNWFKAYDLNDDEDFFACDFYKNVLANANT
jgi:hypothetical protein